MTTENEIEEHEGAEMSAAPEEAKDTKAGEGESFHKTVRAARRRGENLIEGMRKMNLGPADNNFSHPLLYSIGDAARLVGVTAETIRRAEKDQRLPAAELSDSGHRKGYTFPEIQHMRHVFGTIPRRQEGDEVIIISFPNYKGGAYKTSTSVHFAQGMAEKGFSVLFIDADPQGTASHYFRRFPGTVGAGETCGPAMMGEAPLLQFQKTQWPNIDLIPGASDLFIIEMRLASMAEKLIKQGRNSFEVLREALDDLLDEHPDRWDMIVIDSPPALGHLTINAIVCSDICVVPTPAHFADYCSTIEFFRLLESTFETLQDSLEVDLRLVITRYNSEDLESEYMAKQIRTTFRELVLTNFVAHTGEVGKGLLKMHSIYEQPKQMRGHRDAYTRARRIFDNVNSEILERLILPLWPSFYAMKEVK